MSSTREYELKFSIDPEDAETVVSHPLVRPALRDRRIDELHSTYFDTSDALLKRHRFTLRVRKGRAGGWHTLKRTAGSLVDRGEWEQRSDAAQPDAAWLRATPAASLIGSAAGSALEPLFTVDVTRTTMPLRYRRAEVELALDHGHVRSESLALPLDEMELELKAGGARGLHALARRLVRDLPLTLSLVTKSERGYGLRDLTWGRPGSAVRPVLHKRMTNAQAFEAIVQTCLAQLLRNVALIGGEVDVEAVHRARVSLRRLRAACALFKPVLRRRRWAALRAELKWLSDKLGAARDADVFQSGTFDPLARRADIVGAPELAALMQVRRIEAHRALRKALFSARARLLFVETLVFASDGLRRSRQGERFKPFVRKALKKRQRQVARRARGIAYRSAEERHEVRKDAKMLRYSLDFLRGEPAFGDSLDFRGLSKRLKTLQDALGVLQDQVALRTYLRDTVVRQKPRRAVSLALTQARAAATTLASDRSETGPLIETARRAARELR